MVDARRILTQRFVSPDLMSPAYVSYRAALLHWIAVGMMGDADLMSTYLDGWFATNRQVDIHVAPHLANDLATRTASGEFNPLVNNLMTAMGLQPYPEPTPNDAQEGSSETPSAADFERMIAATETILNACLRRSETLLPWLIVWMHATGSYERALPQAYQTWNARTDRVKVNNATYKVTLQETGGAVGSALGLRHLYFMLALVLEPCIIETPAG